MRRLIFPLLGLILIIAAIAQSSWLTSTRGAALDHAPNRSLSTSRPVLKVEGRVGTYPGAESIVGTDVSGTITLLTVAEGDSVRKDQLMAELRSTDLSAAIAEAQAQVAEAEADVRLDQTELERAQKLWTEQVGTKQAVDRATRDLESAAARRATSQATVRKLEAQLDKTRIYSPITGVVVARNVQPGEPVSAGAALFTVADLKRTRIEAEVDEFDIGKVALGTPALISAEGFGDSTWQGKIEEIPDQVIPSRLRPEDPSRPTDTRVLLVKIALLEKAPLKLGQRVQVAIEPQAK